MSDDLFPNAVKSFNNTLSIPLYPSLNDKEVERIIITTKDNGMTIKVKEMTSQNENDYEAFLNEHENSMLYYSLSYRKFLLKTLNNTESKYLLAFNNNKIVAVFALIIKHLKSKKRSLMHYPFMEVMVV